jgi:Domain of unknown function (DUF5610)
MSIPVSGSTNRLADSPVNNSANQASATKARATSESGESTSNTRTQAAAQLNSSILQSSITVNAGNEPLALVLKSAITGINEQLAPQFGENAIQNAASQDNSPEATAERIVSLSTAFLSAFKEQNPELSDDEAASKFLDTIKGGIEKGFAEAKDILQGLKVLSGDVASNIEKTFDLVQQGLAKFAADNGIDGGNKPAGEEDAAGAEPQGTQINSIQISQTSSQSSSFQASIKRQ